MVLYLAGEPATAHDGSFVPEGTAEQVEESLEL